LGLAIAQEAALKMKEAAALQAEAFSAAEIRHGPLALIGPGYPILALGQADATLPGLQALVADLRGLGATVLAADGAAGPADQLPTL
ncbi:SIS domain-containing protein, partial [Enterococcus faecalis]|uniref:SIS domain-containing protein n=1 Tax=Enterococcus faecalis TaxID=1351 RepID=UPI00403F7522